GEQPVGGDCGASDVRDAICDYRLPGIRPELSARARRVRTARRRLANPALSVHLPAADGAGPGGDWHLRVSARLERVPLSVPPLVLDAEHDRAGGAGAVPQQRRRAMELYDGDRDYLCATADRDLLHVPRPHAGRPDGGRGQGLSLATESGRAEEWACVAR